MNSVHDMGGTMGFGAVQPEPDEPPFHARWEERAFAVTIAMGACGLWNLDMHRAARESLPPLRYLSASYYQIWLDALEKMLLGRGLVEQAEISTGKMTTPPKQIARRLSAQTVDGVLRAGAPTQRIAPMPARFAVGDPVRTRMMNPVTHTRLPRYARGRHGTIVLLHGAHIFPDAHALGLGEQPQWLYTVSFDAHELWGADTTAESVCVDCFEPYLC